MSDDRVPLLNARAAPAAAAPALHQPDMIVRTPHTAVLLEPKAKIRTS